ncbi:histidine phosphatase family protein [Corynebacterium falsenii]|uniref:histidine phosphatase family protein n=1 Tax=Corynebacterium falsenii TaxID=108486 RepID=UPI001CCA54F2|nr:histidine phosphatase family protein [Corynebacterium falsenii]MDC7103238.1 histidine phosphatase family protein [Corynebacterium falsenii]UBI07287.1 histidine phosphatase family protein [Corynebacterium falsenii]
MATIVHLVRHGEVHNPDRILYGRLPGYHLSERGRNMAYATAAELADHDVVRLVASPLQRAQETARPFAEKLGLDVVTDERIIEAGNDLEGLHIKGVRSALWNPRRWPMLRKPAEPSWGEPYTQIRDRMWEAIDDARTAARGHEAVLISHQLPIVMIQRDVQGLPLAHNPAVRQCELASVTSLVFDGADLTDMFYAEPAQEI